MTDDRRHAAFLKFVAKLVDVPAGYSKEDLANFAEVSEHQFPALHAVIHEYFRLALQSDTVAGLSREPARSQRSVSSRGGARAEMHLFDLLRQSQLFPSNSDLSDFAGKILPNMPRRRFDKMSRGDIAGRVVEYLETRDPKTRARLETSMREALESGTTRKVDRRSFLSKWEKIIKGIEL